ncbi:MAG: DUF2264 domain-containing protein, partial [Lentisphaeria bacterium]|nr:DUF2264 domain-containing protein [Lentisphaeria bacterium]
IKLVSKSWVDGFYTRPRTDHDELKKHAEGLIVCSACLAGEVPRFILNGDIEEAERRIEWYRSVFGEDYYLEIQRHEVRDPNQRANRETFPLQQQANAVILELAKKHGVKVVCTNDVHFVDEDNAEAHDRLICLGTNRDLDDPKRMLYTKQEWFKTTSEMNAIFADVPEALDNTLVYMYYFGGDGSAIPYGRSLAYRFAEAAFWAAYAYADAGGIEPGVLKGLFLRNMRKWLSRPIFDTSGVLTVGYAYPNMSMAESYNGFGSVYWGMKSFLVLALPEDHPFWAAEELPMPELPASRRMDGPHFIAQRDGAHCVFFAAGQKPRMQHTHGQAKYEKFAYSNLYGFGVPKGPYGLSQIVPDSMLAVTDVGSDRYAVKRDTKDYELTDDWIRTDWSPLMGVTIRTWIVPALPWHVRIHEITADRPLQTFDGGFAFPADGTTAKTDRKSVFVSQSGGMSCGAVDLSGGRRPMNQNTEPNTNLILPRATIPGLQGDIPKGTTTLVSAFFCGDGDRGETPSVTTSDDAYTVRIGGRTVVIPRRK